MRIKLVHVHNGVTSLAGAARTLGQENHKMDFTIHQAGVIVKDNLRGYSVLVPFSNIVSIDLHNEPEENTKPTVVASKK